MRLRDCPRKDFAPRLMRRVPHQFRIAPVLRNLRQPVDAGIRHLNIWVETLRDGFLNDGSSERIEGFELAAFGGDGGVNRRATGIQIRRDALLLRQRRERAL